MEQFGNVSCHHHSYIWHNKQNKTNAHLHVSIFLAEFSGLYFFLCLCLSVAHFFVQWFSLCFFFVFTFIFIFFVCFCFCLFVFLIQVTLKSNHGKGVSGIRLIFTNLAMLVVAIWTKKNWSIHEVPHSSSGKYLHPWHSQLFFSTWDCHVLSCLSK